MLREFLIAFGFALVALGGILWLSQSVALIDNILLRGGGVSSFLRLSVYLLPEILVNIAPLAALAGMLFTMNQLATGVEILVTVAAGRNPIKSLYPALMGGILIAIIFGAMAVFLAPQTRSSIKNELVSIAQNFSKNIITPREFVSPLDDVVIYADQSELSGEMLNVFISDQRDPNILREFYADRALLTSDGNRRELALIQGQAHQRERNSNNITVTQFDRLEVALGDVSDAELGSSNSIDTMPTKDVFSVARGDTDQKGRARGELSARLGIGYLLIIMPIIAVLPFLPVPYARNGYRTPLIVGSVTGIVAYALFLASKSAIADGAIGYFLFAAPLGLSGALALFYYRMAEGAR